MSTLPPPDANDASSLTDGPAAGSVAVRAMALALWVVVGSLLVYGVAQTVIKASALFA